MAVTRAGIPVRVGAGRGNTSDSVLIRQVKDQMRAGGGVLVRRGSHVRQPALGRFALAPVGTSGRPGLPGGVGLVHWRCNGPVGGLLVAPAVEGWRRPPPQPVTDAGAEAIG